MSGSSRVQILDFPPKSPGKCVICGSVGGNNDARKFIDFGFDLDYYGVIYFCSLCILDMVNSLGYLSDQQAKLLTHNYEILSDSHRSLEAENVKLRAALSQLNFLGPGNIDDSPSEEPVEQERSNDTGSDEQTNERGSTDVPTVKHTKPKSTKPRVESEQSDLIDL